jgi:hypothetical protein
VAFDVLFRDDDDLAWLLVVARGGWLGPRRGIVPRACGTLVKCPLTGTTSRGDESEGMAIGSQTANVTLVAVASSITMMALW